jgi:hypothetical protein
LARLHGVGGVGEISTSVWSGYVKSLVTQVSVPSGKVAGTVGWDLSVALTLEA